MEVQYFCTCRFFANVFPTCRNLAIMLTLNSCTSKTLAKVNWKNNKQPCWTERLHSSHHMLKTKRGIPMCITPCKEWIIDSSKRNAKCSGEFWCGARISMKLVVRSVPDTIIITQYMLLNSSSRAEDRGAVGRKESSQATESRDTCSTLRWQRLHMQQL